MTQALAAPATAARAPRAGIGRLFRAELRWIFHRPRTLIVLGLLAVIPAIIGVALTLAGSQPGPSSAQGPPGAGLLASSVGNSLVLPVAALTMMLAFLLPLTASMPAADALAGETSQGTLRGWLLAPVSRGRLLTVKALGVGVVITTAVLLVALVGVLTGLLMNDSGSLVTLSGTTVSFGGALGRVAIAAGWVIVQLLAVGAVALAISSLTEHPMLVVVAVLAGDIVFTVLGTLDALSWLHPFLLTEPWQLALTTVLREPMPLDSLADGTLRAVCYIAIGLSLAYARLTTKDG